MLPRWWRLQLLQPKQQEQSHKIFKIVTYNATAWQSAKVFLQETQAEVVLLQESHICAQAADEVSAAARKLGWKVIQSVAIPGKGICSSGGLMILAQAWLGLSAPARGGHILVEGRAVAAIVECAGFFPLAVV